MLYRWSVVSITTSHTVSRVTAYTVYNLLAQRWGPLCSCNKRRLIHSWILTSFSGCVSLGTSCRVCVHVSLGTSCGACVSLGTSFSDVGGSMACHCAITTETTVIGWMQTHIDVCRHNILDSPHNYKTWREGYLLPTWARKIACWHFNWMLQLSSGTIQSKRRQELTFPLFMQKPTENPLKDLYTE